MTGTQLEIARKMSGITQKELAALLEVTQATLSKWEAAGDRVLGVRALGKIKARAPALLLAEASPEIHARAYAIADLRKRDACPNCARLLTIIESMLENYVLRKL